MKKPYFLILGLLAVFAAAACAGMCLKCLFPPELRTAYEVYFFPVILFLAAGIMLKIVAQEIKRSRPPKA